MSVEIITWKIEQRKISELSPAKYNPRQMSVKQAKDLKKSLDKFNLAEPIIINKNNNVIGGHQRLNVLRAQDPNMIVPVSVPSRLLTDAEERELNIRLNANLGQWDFDILANEFDTTLLCDWGLDLANFETPENTEELTKNVKELDYLSFVVTINQKEFILNLLEKQKGENLTEKLLCALKKK